MMKSEILNILLQVLPTGISLAVVTIFAKKYAEKAAESIFAKRMEQYKHEKATELVELKNQLDSLSHRQTELLNYRIKLFGELSQVIYTQRSIAKRIISKINENDELAIIDDLIERVTAGNEDLFQILSRSRFYLSKDAFEAVHKFKQKMCNFAVALNLKSGSNAFANKRELTRLYAEIDSIYLDATALLQTSLLD